MDVIPTCQENKEQLLTGLKLINKIKEKENDIAEYAINKADQYGITKKNFQKMAQVAHRFITQSPKTDNENPGGGMIPIYRETNEGLLVGSKLIKATENVIREYANNKAEQYGITKKNIKQIAQVAHKFIMQTAPAALKKAYHEWLEAPLSQSTANQPLNMRQEDLQQLNALIMQSLSR